LDFEPQMDETVRCGEGALQYWRLGNTFLNPQFPVPFTIIRVDLLQVAIAMLDLE
jgi:hypothetical protein